MMARVEVRPSGGHSYAVVVEDVHQGGEWKKKVIRSFGNIDTDPTRMEAAEKFANAVNAGEYLRALGMTDAELKRTLGYVVTGAVLGFAVSWLTKKD